MAGDVYKNPFQAEPKQLEFFVKDRCRPILPLITPKVIARFWARVVIREADTCWFWNTDAPKNEYGSFHIHGAKASFPTHRVSLAIASGRDPIDFFLCHKCDNRPCVNPFHLEAGTNVTNAQDKIRKGRYRVWSRSATLQWEHICEVKKIPLPDDFLLACPYIPY